MNREELKALGLSDEQIDKVMAAHGKVVNDTKKKADEVDGLKTQIDDYKKQLKDRDNQLKDLGDKAKGNEDLTAEIDRLKQANKDTQTEYEGKLQKQVFDHKLENTLAGAKVKNTKALRALLDMDTIKLDGDKLLGLDDQLKALQESDGYLFEEVKQEPAKPSFSTGQHQKPSGSAPSTLLDALSQKFTETKN
ncbi:archaellum component FlaC [Cytobacillus horneckiae]|uniref:phage scaffolding protein n=1 Tax=Cytobacillus horneckiae TaxID=549687 RepID=UPI0019D271FC|nr:phage scaffolding protein [Cytobacillus horneckiae]MBN6889907.1 phage scaffolding protein [Cytobacillus horneckiae]